MKNVDSDQMPHPVTSKLGLHYVLGLSAKDHHIYPKYRAKLDLNI